MAEDIVTLGMAVDSRQVKDAKASLDQLATSGGRAEQATNNLTSASDRLSGVVRMLASAYATLKVTQYAQEAAMLSQRYQQMGIVMGVVAANTGQTKAVFESTAQSLQKLGISMLESRNTVIKLATANIDLANAEKLADLARNAAIVGNMNTSQALDTLVHGIQSAQVEVLRTIGINVNFERSYADLAKQLGVNSNNLTEAQKQQARMNVVLAESVNFNGLYEASLANAGKMMKSTERLSENLKIKVGAIFDDSAMLAVSAYSNQLLDLNSKADRFAANGAIKEWSRQIAIELAFVMDMGRNVFGIFGALGGMIAEQGKNIANLDFDKMSATFANADKELKAVMGDTSKYQDMVNDRIIQEFHLSEKITGQNNNIRENTKVQNENTEAVVKAVKAKQQLTLAELQMQESTKRTIDLDRDAKNLTRSVATEQEKYNTTLEELNRLKPYVTVETYNRALEKAQKELKGTEVQTRQTTDEVSQLWMQAGRNIQSTLANSIFNFFDDGLKGMLKNVISTVGRIASEIAALNIAKGIGLAGMFGAGNAVAGGGIGGTGSALNLASMGSSALNLFKVGGGISQGVSSLFGLGATGTQAAAQAGASTLWGASGASAASGIGSSIASFAGPAIAVAAVDQIVRMLAGDKMIGGTAGKVLNFVPVLGPLINGLFGRGPMKQQGTLLEGQIGAEGFESGMLQTRFKAKGGAFRSDKIDFSRVDAVTGATFTDNGKLAGFTEELAEAGKQIFDSINEATKQTTIALRGVAGNLGLATGGIDDFNYSLNILTEKGEMIQGEQIAEEIAKISEGLANSLMPNIKEFQRSGETAINTLLRLSTEFSVLTSAAGLLFDKSSQWSKDFVTQFGFGDRSAFLEKAGGAQAFAANVAGFAQNFLTEDQRMKPVIESLVSERDSLGLSGINTREQYTSAVQSGNMTPEQLIFLLRDPAGINQVFTYLENLKAAVHGTHITFGQAAESIKKTNAAMAVAGSAQNADETQQGREINKRIADVTESIKKMEAISSQLRGTVNSINPISINQARSQILNGGLDASNLGDSLSALSNMSTSGFSNVLDFKRAKGANTVAINALQNMADKDIMASTRKLNALNTEKENFQQSLLAAVTAMTLALNKDNRRGDRWDAEGMPPVRAA